MTVQHVYEGSGSPNGVVVAPVGSHYTDLDTEEPWLCVWSDGTDSSWMRLADNLDVRVVISGAWNVGAPTNREAIVSAGTELQFTSQPGSVWANVELTNDRTYTAAAPCFVRLRVAGGGDGLVAIITPLTEHFPPA